uniref:E3 ubiquitin/ISG15 ligase TRIM25-like n=1 Tax=Oryzias latipes TaxID=8090 RepID=A0A3P9K714_ORYLA
MASARSEQSSVLQEELTCPVCLDLYRDPHLLPCGHNFCKNCLDRLKRQAERGRLRCPECRDSHRCSTNFQKNFKLANIADDYRHQRRAAATALKSRETLSFCLGAPQEGGTFSVPCDYCPPPAAKASTVDPSKEGDSAAGEDGGAQEDAAARFAVKTCLKCEVSMCQEHVKPHLELPAFREHPLTEPMNDLWKRKCPDHDEIYRYYCMDDKMCVCNACTIEGGHSGHTIKTLKNTMKDLKKFMDDTEESLTRLSEEMKAKVLRFITRLRECTRTQCDTNGPLIQKNLSRICQDQARLQEVRCSIEGLMQENDPFRFIQTYKTTGKQLRRQLRKTMFYPEYVDMETELLGVMMEEEMRKFLEEELPCHIVAAITSLCHLSDPEEEEEQEDNEEEGVDLVDDDEEDDDDDDLDDSSEEEMRSEGEEDEVEEEESNQELVDDLYSPGEEDEEEDEEDDDEDENEEDE